jgi:hypothetical protein
MKKVALSTVKDDLSRFLRLAEKELDCRLQKDPRFLARVEAARKSLRDGRGVKLWNIKG